jgi:mannose-6-phosphate isomerase-like protein (cupin superfamily)
VSTPIQTHSPDGKPNGWLLPLWNVNERTDLRPDQVYLTVVASGCSKGPHLHKKREQRYYVIKGDCEVITRDPVTGEYAMRYMWPGDVEVVPAGVPSQLRNKGIGEAWLINMPSPAWSPDDQDEWPVENWTA